MGLWFEDRKYLFQVDYKLRPKWKNQRKRTRGQKDHRIEEVPFAVGGKSRGLRVGRPSLGEETRK